MVKCGYEEHRLVSNVFTPSIFGHTSFPGPTPLPLRLGRRGHQASHHTNNILIYQSQYLKHAIRIQR